MWVYADVAQLVERQLPKLKVAGSNPVARFIRHRANKFDLTYFFNKCLKSSRDIEADRMIDLNVPTFRARL